MSKDKVRYINGFSESAWKSLIVKALRVGWPSAIEAAANILPKSTVNSLLLAGLFEDLFPSSLEELNNQYQLILDRNYIDLCKFETHHGRGYTSDFCKLKDRALEVREKPSMMHDIISTIYGKTQISFITPRVNNCVWTWYKINPGDVNPGRTIIEKEFTEMPESIMDSHTYERKVKIGVLSGHYENHMKIGIEVSQYGWDRIRSYLLKEKSYPVQSIQKELF